MNFKRRNSETSSAESEELLQSEVEIVNAEVAEEKHNTKIASETSEYNSARGSTLNAHYTSDEIIQGIYAGLKNLGFNQGTILQKLDHIRDDENLPDWVNVDYFHNNKEITINKYSTQHPEDVLGILDKTSTAYGFDLTCKPDESRPLADLLQESMQSMQKIYYPSEIELPMPQQIPDIDDKRPSSFFIENGEIKFFNGVKVENIKVSAKDRVQMLSAMDIRDSVRKVINIQVNDGSDDELEKAQKILNALYDKHVVMSGQTEEEIVSALEFDRIFFDFQHHEYQIAEEFLR